MIHYIISYDITNNHLRQKVAYDLEKYGAVRLQKSVFIAANMRMEEIHLIKKALLDRMKKHSKHLPTDSLLCFPIKKKAIKEMVWAGEEAHLREVMQEILFMLF